MQTVIQCLQLLTEIRCGEKYLAWTDEPLPSKTILEFVSLYWLTETFPRAIYPYREVCVLILVPMVSVIGAFMLI